MKNRKKTLLLVFLLLIGCMMVLLVFNIFLKKSKPSKIGGADGPTSILVTENGNLSQHSVPSIWINNNLYFNTGTTMPIEPDPSVIEYVEKPIGDISTEQATAWAMLEGDTLAVLINGEWYEFKTNTDNYVGIKDIEARYAVQYSDDWGITLTPSKVTSTGLTLECYHDGYKPNDLQTSSWFKIERLNGDSFVEIEPITDCIGWEDIAWIIMNNKSVHWDIDWTNLYGSLEPGIYRIIKEIRSYYPSNEKVGYDMQIHHAIFEIVDCECAVDEVPRLIMVNDELYYDTAEESTVDGRCGNMDGTIESSMSGGEGIPKKNNSSNFGVGYGYQYGPDEGTIEVLIDGRWCVFEKYENFKQN